MSTGPSDIGWRTVTVQVPDAEAHAPSQKMSIADTTTDSIAKEEGDGQFYISGGTRNFLKGFLEHEGGKDDAISATDVARLRLIAAAEHRSGNDTVRVGVHDANILFRDRHTLDITSGEKYALLVAGLKYMEHQNVPFWAWTDGNADRSKQIIQSWMGFSEGDEHISALKLGTALGYDVPDYGLEDGRRAVLRSWFLENSSYALEQATTGYLIKLGKPGDIEILDQITEKKSGQRPANIANIAVAIQLRQSTEVGIEELLRRDPEQLEDHVLQALTCAFEGLSSEELIPITKLKSEGARLRAVQELRHRQALSQQSAEELSGDSSFDVRLEALLALSDLGIQLPDSRVRSLLVKPSQTRGTGLAGLFGFGGNDSSRFEVFQKYTLRRRPLDELSAMEEENGSPINADAFIAACEAYPRQMTQHLITSLKDGFYSRFDEKFRRLKSTSSDSEKLLDETLRLKDFSCLLQTQSGLDVLVSQMRAADVALVRSVVDSWELTGSEPLLRFFERFGDWGDIDRILKLKAPISGRGTILGLGRMPDQHAELIGKTLYRLGRHRIIDLLSKLDGAFKMKIIRFAAKNTIKGLPDGILLKLMNDKDNDLRKIICLRCLESLPKTRISGLLRQYAEQDDYRYYNTIHWLDLGNSMPRDIVLKVVQFELQT